MKPNVSFREAAASALGPELLGRDRLQSAKTGHSVRALNFMEMFIR
jgi:hypothetical protein